MAFLQRQRTARADEKSANAAQAVHPRVAAATAAGSAGIIRRVSSIFLPRKKPAPPNLALVSAALACAPRRMSYDSSSRASTDSEDDIRIPSGLGSAASDLGSLPPSPFFHAFPTPPGYHRPRSASSPNFETTFNVKMREAPFVVRKPPMPPAVFALVAPHLHRVDLAACATLARAYAEPARAALYAHIDLDALAPPHAEKLLALLAARADLPALVAAFTCRAWPPFFVPAGSSPPSAHSTRLTAALACALARMSALEALTLPAFDAALLARHSAFGLRALTLTARSMGAADARALFAWLDGQTNIVSLRLPHLAEGALAAGPRLPRARSSPHLPPGPAEAEAASPRVPAFAPRVPAASALAVQLGAPTLLPNLATLHAPPALALLLTAPLAGGSALPPAASSLPFPAATDSGSTPTDPPNTPIPTGPRRPLKSLTITLSTTLYTGLRPAALMCALRGGPTHLSLRVARAVDRRTVEKVVGAVGAALGGGDGIKGDAAKETGGASEGGEQVVKKRWEGTGRVPFAMPLRASAADLPLPFPVQAAGADADALALEESRAWALGAAPTKTPRDPSVKPMVARAPIVRDEDDEEEVVEPAVSRALVVESIRARTISAATKKGGMVARAPVVRDEEEEDEDAPATSTLVVESARVRTVSTATKSGMIARAPVVRDDDDDDGVVEGAVKPALLVESVRPRTISTTTKSGMVARAPVVRDDEYDDEDEGEKDAKATPAAPVHPRGRVRTISAALAKSIRSLPSSPMVARAPTVRGDDPTDADDTPADALRPLSTASDTPLRRTAVPSSIAFPRPLSTASDSSSRRARAVSGKLLLAPRAPFARDDGESEGLVSPLVALSFRSRTESTSRIGRTPMVARGPTVRDEPDDDDDDNDDNGTTAVDVRPSSIASDISSRRKADAHRVSSALLLAPRAPDAESEYLVSPLAAQSFRSRTESTSGASSVPSKTPRMVARAATVRDDADEEDDDEKVEQTDATPVPELQDTTPSTSGVRTLSVFANPPAARPTAGQDSRARTVSAGSAIRRHGRTLSGKLKAMVSRVSRAEPADAMPVAQPAPAVAVGQHWPGLVSLEVAFHATEGDNAAREEAVYKSLSASLARYRVLTSLTLRILPEESDSPTAGTDDVPHAPREPAANEHDLLDAWARLCPTLQSVTLFSGARWQKGHAPPKKPVHVMMQLTAPGQPFLL